MRIVPGAFRFPGNVVQAESQTMNTIHKNLRTVRKKARQFANALFVDRTAPAQTVVLYSSGRSGSTWLSDLLHSLPRTRLVFEPFHPRHGVKDLAPYRYRYLVPATAEPVLERAYAGVLKGTRTTRWVEQLNNPACFIYERRIVKLVRANLLFPWLASQYPQHKNVLLLRHPAAVVLSQVSNGWDLSSRRIRDQEALLQQPGIRAMDQFGWPDSGFQSNLLFWAAENRVAIDHALQSNTLVVFYEELCLAPGKVLDELGRFLGSALPDDAARKVNKASWSSSAEVGSMSVTEKISRWRDALNPEQRAQVEQVLDVSGMGEYYSLEPSPAGPGIDAVRQHNRRVSAPSA